MSGGDIDLDHPPIAVTGNLTIGYGRLEQFDLCMQSLCLMQNFEK